MVVLNDFGFTVYKENLVFISIARNGIPSTLTDAFYVLIFLRFLFSFAVFLLIYSFLLKPIYIGRLSRKRILRVFLFIIYTVCLEQRQPRQF